MLQELYSRIEQTVEELPENLKSKILDIFSNIDIVIEAKKLEKQVSEQLKKRGQAHEEE